MLLAERRPSWLERVRTGRDHLVATERFRRWAAACPITRPLARRRARAVFDLCAGFVYSQVLVACVRLGLFEALAGGPRTAAVLGARVSVPEEAMGRLLEAAASLRLVTRVGEGYRLGPLGAPLAGNDAVLAMVRHHELLYADLADPVALLRGERGETRLAAYWPYAAADRPDRLTAEGVAAYSSLMAASQPLLAGEVLEAYDLGGHRCLLDVGGGDGAFVTAAAARWPGLRLMVFDLPAVAARARSRLADAGLADRCAAIGGDFLRDPLPTGADVAALIRVIHDQDDARALVILRAVRRALPDGGTLVIAEPMADLRGAEPVGAAYFGFYLLAMGRGKPRSPAQLHALLAQSGFGQIRLVSARSPVQTGIMAAAAV